MKRVEIPRRLLYEWMDSYLSRNGIDLSKEKRIFSKWEKDLSVTIVVEQDDNAATIETKEDKLAQALANVPAYLKGMK